MEDVKKIIEQYRIDKFFIGMVFASFCLITCYKLTNAPLWLDETTEYWYSKIMFGALPFENSANMYQRIVSTYQPPLYNFLMYFWLKVSDTEWWFRFFGVIMGCIGMTGIYKSVQKIGKNTFVSSMAVLFSSFTYTLVYYWQECAEYCLMLGSLCWTIYFWICLMEEINRKNIILFTTFAIIPVYSQYGAIFPIAVMIISAFINVMLKKDKKNIIEIIMSYICAFIFFAVPLYIFFLKKQMINQNGASNGFKVLNFENGIFNDICKNLFVVFKWNMASYYSSGATKILLVIIIIAFVITLLKGNKIVKCLDVVNIFTWIIYYLFVKEGLYSYGGFGNRYNLFFVPLWMVSGFAVFIEIYRIIKTKIFIKRWDIHVIYTGVMICFILCFCVLGWNEKLQENWGKEDCRGVVNAWYQQNAAEKNTIVYYGAATGFAYYVRRNEVYTDEKEKNVTYMQWSYSDQTDDEYREYINGVYGDIWPEEVYIVASHTIDDVNILIDQFLNIGYVREEIYNSGGGMLIKLTQAKPAMLN